MAPRYSKFGIDANQPIDGNGNIAARLQNPDFIASTGAHWVRLNFVLPHPGFLDRYDVIINNFISREMKILATVGHDATGDFRLGNTLRDPGSGDGAGWIQRYAQRFLEIVERYRGRVFAFEAINEPNGWQGGGSALVHPRWFVYLMNALYQTIRPRERGIRLISGPLEATWVNNNEAAVYLDAVYRLGNWAPDEAPWDGIGYHLYVGEDPASPPGSDGSIRPEDVRQTYADFLGKMWGVIQSYEPNTNTKLWVSEFGWTSDLGEDYQAEQIRLAMDLLANDERVAVASLFCTEDFSKLYGVYAKDMTRAKRAYQVYQGLMRQHAPNRSRVVDFTEIDRPVTPPIVGPPGEDDSVPWSVSPGLMRHPVEERSVILLPPFDDGSWARAVLAAGYHGQGGMTLCWSPGEAALTIAGEQRRVLVINPDQWGTPDGSMVPWFAQNAPGVVVLERTFETPQALTDWLRSTPDPFVSAG